MSSLVFKYALFIHVICGFLSLVSGSIAMAVKKGGKYHNLAGKVFYWAMFGVFITTVLFFVLYPTHLKYQFFLCIGMVSFYPTWSGERVLRMKKGINATFADKTAAFGIGLSGLIMVGYGIYGQLSLHNFGGLEILFIVFGFTSLFNAYGDLKLYLGFSQPKEMHWFFGHAGKMIGAYAAAWTAFCVNVVPGYLPDNAPGYLQILTWILPGLVFIYIGKKIIRKFKIKFKLIPQPV